MKVAIIHKDNLLFLTIRKSIDECRLIAVLNNPLQIREGISSSYDDSTGIKTIDMQLKGQCARRPIKWVVLKNGKYFSIFSFSRLFKSKFTDKFDSLQMLDLRQICFHHDFC